MQANDLINYTYRIIRPIGSGGLGSIFLAYHENLKKYVIVKKVHDRFTSLVNCRIEVDILKSLHHQYLPQVYDFIEAEDGIFTVMDYISGYDLQHYIDAGWVFDEETLLKWLRQLCEVLDYLHTRQPKIIHCDIKPANIMITETGDVCLIDFNISLDGVNNKDLVGYSSQHASPEQILKAQSLMRGQAQNVMLDERSDLYSLGAVFYEMISGYMPEERRKSNLMLKDIAVEYSSNLVNIIDKAMNLSVNGRFKSAAKMLEALDHFERWSKAYRRKVRIMGFAGIGLTALIAVMICVGVTSYRQKRSDAFFEDYEKYIAITDVLYESMVDDADFQKILDEGKRFLNDSSHEHLLEKYPEEKGNVLYAMGQAAMKLDAYDRALDYLKQAEEYLTDSSDVARDMAITCALSGDSRMARLYLEDAKSKGLDFGEGRLVEAQLAWVEKDYESAYELAVSAARDNVSEDIVERAAILAVQASGELKNYEQCYTFSEEMANKSRGSVRMLWIQKGAELSVLALENGAAEAPWILRGITNYEQLQKEGYAGFTDLSNLAWLYEKDNDLKCCKELLSTMLDLFPEQYRVPMDLAYIYYRMANDVSPATRDYTKVQLYYEQAVKLYEKDGAKAEQNAELMQLKTIIDQLIAGGWLKG